MKEIESVKRGIVLLLLVLTGIGSAWADRGYGHRYGHGYGHRSAQFGFVITPGWGPWYYPPPFYYPPTQPIVIERAPPVYIEQVLPAPGPPRSSAPQWTAPGPAILVLLQEWEGLLSLRQGVPRRLAEGVAAPPRTTLMLQRKH